MKGSCNCGSVTFLLKGNTPNLYQCHCSLCRKQSGTASNVSIIYAFENFTWLSGQSSITKWQKETGFNSHFCKHCGSPVPNPFFNSKFMWVPAGLVDELESKTIAHICCGSKATWNALDDTAEMHIGMPEDFEEFVKFLHK